MTSHQYPGQTWLTQVQTLHAQGQVAAVVTVVATRGHSPRGAGAKMVVSDGGSWGSIGGGNLEERAIRRARHLLSGAAASEVLECELSPHAPAEHGRQCCGGHVQVLIEVLAPPARVVIVGAGHVGHELARILSRLPLELHLVDARPEQLTVEKLTGVLGQIASVTIHCAALPEMALEEVGPGAHVVIMTHDHAEDLAVADAALRLPVGAAPASVGVIGSAAKAARMRAALRELGHDAATIDRVQCPIAPRAPGLAGGNDENRHAAADWGTSKHPVAIAVAIAAVLLPRCGITDAHPSQPAPPDPEPAPESEPAPDLEPDAVPRATPRRTRQGLA